jgi:hypothetical protein
MPRYRERVCLESGLRLDLNNLRRQGYVKRGRDTAPKSICWRDAASGRAIAFGSIYSHAESPSEGGSLHIAIEELSQNIRLKAVPRPVATNGISCVRLHENFLRFYGCRQGPGSLPAGKHGDGRSPIVPSSRLRKTVRKFRLARFAAGSGR